MIGEGWVAAGDLEVGDEVYNLDGTVSVVIGSEVEKLDEPVLVYNLEVEDLHSYFVGCVPVLVHNYQEDHHVASNKSKKYTPEFQKIANKFNLNLNDDWNIIKGMENHHGRHNNHYHEFILSQMKIFADSSSSDVEFLAKFDMLKNLLNTDEYRGMMYSDFWRGYK